MNKKLMLIVNPFSGMGGYKNSLGKVLEVFYRAGFLPTVYFITDKDQNIDDIIIANASGYDLVVSMGGDGTFSRAVSGLIRLEKAPPLGHIPTGTTNDIAQTLGLPKSAEKVAEKIATGTPAPFDVGSFGEDGHFSYIAAFGAFTDISYETPQAAKHALGYLAYILEGMRRLPANVSYKVKIRHDSGELEEDLVFGSVSNTASVAGVIKLDSDLINLSDGQFEAVLIKTPANIGDLNKIIGDLLSRKFRSDQVIILQSSKLHFTFSEPVAWTVDGERGGTHQELLLTNNRAAVYIVK